MSQNAIHEIPFICQYIYLVHTLDGQLYRVEFDKLDRSISQLKHRFVYLSAANFNVWQRFIQWRLPFVHRCTQIQKQLRIFKILQNYF